MLVPNWYSDNASEPFTSLKADDGTMQCTFRLTLQIEPAGTCSHQSL